MYSNKSFDNNISDIFFSEVNVMGKMISISEVSKLTGVTIKTLKIWDIEGKFKAKYKTPGGHRRYDLDDVEKLLGNSPIPQDTKTNVFIYCRVSTKKQQEAGNLQRQKDRIILYCNEKRYNIVQIFAETASGLNDNRRELKKMLERLSEVNLIIIEYPDRLARFGYNFLKEFAKSFNVDIETVEQNKKLGPNEEMVNDLISIVTSFSARLYGKSGGRKIKQDIKKSIKELDAEGGRNCETYNESHIN
jgi:predicted site-specific integrase-resolvase